MSNLYYNVEEEKRKAAKYERKYRRLIKQLGGVDPVAPATPPPSPPSSPKAPAPKLPPTPVPALAPTLKRSPVMVTPVEQPSTVEKIETAVEKASQKVGSTFDKGAEKLEVPLEKARERISAAQEKLGESETVKKLGKFIGAPSEQPITISPEETLSTAEALTVYAQPLGRTVTETRQILKNIDAMCGSDDIPKGDIFDAIKNLFSELDDKVKKFKQEHKFSDPDLMTIYQQMYILSLYAGFAPSQTMSQFAQKAISPYTKGLIGEPKLFIYTRENFEFMEDEEIILILTNVSAAARRVDDEMVKLPIWKTKHSGRAALGGANGEPHEVFAVPFTTCADPVEIAKKFTNTVQGRLKELDDFMNLLEKENLLDDKEKIKVLKNQVKGAHSELSKIEEKMTDKKPITDGKESFEFKDTPNKKKSDWLLRVCKSENDVIEKTYNDFFGTLAGKEGDKNFLRGNINKQVEEKLKQAHKYDFTVKHIKNYAIHASRLLAKAKQRAQEILGMFK